MLETKLEKSTVCDFQAHILTEVFEQQNFAEICLLLLKPRVAHGNQEPEWMASSPLRRWQAICQLLEKHIPLLPYPLSQLHSTALVSMEKLKINHSANTDSQLIHVPEKLFFFLLIFLFHIFSHEEWKFDHQCDGVASTMFSIRSIKSRPCLRTCLLHANNNHHNGICISHRCAFSQISNRERSYSFV